MRAVESGGGHMPIVVFGPGLPEAQDILFAVLLPASLVSAFLILGPKPFSSMGRVGMRIWAWMFRWSAAGSGCGW